MSTERNKLAAGFQQNGFNSKSNFLCWQVGNHVSKSVVGGSECGQDKSSPPAHNSKEHLSSLVREISQAKLMNIRKKRSSIMASHDGGKSFYFIMFI